MTRTEMADKICRTYIAVAQLPQEHADRRGLLQKVAEMERQFAWNWSESSWSETADFDLITTAKQFGVLE